MNVNFEYLEMIPELKNMIIKLSSPFLSRKELAEYLKVSESFIKQRLYSGELQENKHFFKISNSTMLFDRLEIDEWVRGAERKTFGKRLRKERQTLSEYLSQESKSAPSNES
jgi:transcriptional antiterminator